MADDDHLTLSLHSNVTHTYLCSCCEEDGLQIEAQHFCNDCRRYCCEKCVLLHNKIFKKHEVLDYKHKECMWPILNKTVYDIDRCEEHQEETVKLFCKDHKRLCCVYCHHSYHRKCHHVVPIDGEMKGINNQDDLLEMTEDIKGPFLKRLKAQQSEIKKKLEGFEDAFETIWIDMNNFREKINAWLDDLEDKSKSELQTILDSLKDSCKRDIQTNSELHDKYLQLHKAFKNIQHESDRNALILNCKYNCLVEESESLHQRIQNTDDNLLFQPDAGILQLFSELNGLGTIQTYTNKPNEIIRIMEKTRHSVRIRSDPTTCDVVGICELPNGQVLVADQNNSNVKLLDTAFTFISKLKLTFPPKHMCKAGVDHIAVAVSDGFTHEINFLRIKQGSICLERSIQLEHPTTSVAIHKDQLYVTSWDALYKYSILGLVQTRLYVDKNTSLYKCAVNRDGTRIYVTTYKKNQILTLAEDGTLLSALENPRLLYPDCVYISPFGQVLVCGRRSKNVIQIDEDGREKLETVATCTDVLPQCVCFKRRPDSL